MVSVLPPSRACARLGGICGTPPRVCPRLSCKASLSKSSSAGVLIASSHLSYAPFPSRALGVCMSEIEIHHEHGHEADAFGKKIGVLVGVIGILLAAVTIASHREHTAAVIHKTEANDQWSYYQAKKIRGEVL